MRKVVKPDYYDDFVCVADKCMFTCCREWKIGVDNATQKRWEKLPYPPEMGKRRGHLCDTICFAEDGAQIKLREDGLCPFLDEQQLCRLVKTYGEGCLSKTCHTFPRESHCYTDVTEYALSAGCPQALCLLWKQEQFKLQQEMMTEDAMENLPRQETNLVAIRDFFLWQIRKETESLPETLKLFFFLMKDLYEREQSGDALPDNPQEIFGEDVLAQVKEAIRQVPASEDDSFYEQNELLLDLAENYRQKHMYSEDLEPIAMRAQAYEEQLPAMEHRMAFAQIWKQHEAQMRLLVAEEIYASLLLPEGDCYSMTMKLQWLTMEYAVIRQWNYLYWDIHGELTEESFTKSVAILFRMTGYSEADIEEYLSDSFASVIWDWGYLALVAGS